MLFRQKWTSLTTFSAEFLILNLEPELKPTCKSLLGLHLPNSIHPSIQAGTFLSSFPPQSTFISIYHGNEIKRKSKLQYIKIATARFFLFFQFCDYIRKKSASTKKEQKFEKFRFRLLCVASTQRHSFCSACSLLLLFRLLLLLLLKDNGLLELITITIGHRI
jgi:hypothetical protein